MFPLRLYNHETTFLKHFKKNCTFWTFKEHSKINVFIHNLKGTLAKYSWNIFFFAGRSVNERTYCTCVILGTVWITVSIVVVFSGEPEASVFVHSRAGFSRLQLQMDGVVGGSILQDILISHVMLLLPPILYLDV